jgi:hypothetical protein
MIKIIYDKVFNKYNSGNFPLYILINNKLIDDYNYFDKIMNFLKDLDYKNELFDITEEDYSEMLISYIEMLNFDKEYLFIMIDSMTKNNLTNKKIIEYILIKYPNYINQSKNNSLYYAINMNVSQDIINNLIDQLNIDQINHKNNINYTVLYYAIITKNKATIRKLLNRNIDVNISNSIDLMLYLCIQNNILDDDILNKLVDETEKNNLSDILNLSLLAINKNINENIVEKIIKKFDIKFKDTEGNNILMKFINYLNNKDFEKKKIYINLFMNNIDINEKNNNFETVLDILLLNTKLKLQYILEIINIIIEKDKDKKIDYINNELLNTSRLIIAINRELPQSILEKFIDPTIIKKIDKKTSLNALMNLLILIGNNPDYLDYYNADFVKKLLDNGADKKYITPYGRSALSFALYTKNIDIIKMVYDEKIINVIEIININILDKDEINNIDDISDINVTILDRALDSKNNINVFGLLLLYNAQLLKRHVIKIVNRFTIHECIELFKINFNNNKKNIMKLKLNLKIFLEKYKNKNDEIYNKYNKIYEKYKTIKKYLSVTKNLVFLDNV